MTNDKEKRQHSYFEVSSGNTKKSLQNQKKQSPRSQEVSNLNTHDEKYDYSTDNDAVGLTFDTLLKLIDKEDEGTKLQEVEHSPYRI
jgi:hypothetical protein